MTERRNTAAGEHEREERLRAIVPLLKRVEGDVELMLYGLSMEPTIPDASVIRIRCREPETCRVGDVVVMQAGSRIIAHRVLHRGRRGRAREYLITRGDARWLPDPPVPVASLLGVVAGVAAGETWSPPSAAREESGWAAALSFAVLRSALELNVTLGRSLAAALAGLRRGYLGLRRTMRAIARGKNSAP
ncbi:MAG: hypothetical protein HKM89_00165 [Gemmatimonadales bacterium]|nr:hypothetical protein [Gemmatimonadales bacterium]